MSDPAGSDARTEPDTTTAGPADAPVGVPAGSAAPSGDADFADGAEVGDAEADGNEDADAYETPVSLPDATNSDRDITGG